MHQSGQQFIEEVFSSEGPLSLSIQDFELRKEQKAMALRVLAAYEEGCIALIEAGTGIGKSWAYLIPTLFWCVRHGEQAVISTHTIPLQEQLIEKDIPFLLKVLQVDIKPVLVKGMGNYLCHKRLDEALRHGTDGTPSDRDTLLQIEDFAAKNDIVCSSSTSFEIERRLWNFVAAERSLCTATACPWYKDCSFFKARRKMADAKLLIVNHHLLMADLRAKRDSVEGDERSLLPRYSRLVIDEAHHLDDVALETFASRVDRVELTRLLGRLYSDLQPERSRLIMLLRDLTARSIANEGLKIALQLDLPAAKRELVDKIEKLFSAIDFFWTTYGGKLFQAISLRLAKEHLDHPYWQQEIVKEFLDVIERLKKFSQQIQAIRSLLPRMEKSEEEKVMPHLQELDLIASQMMDKAQMLAVFIDAKEDFSRVRWMERTGFMSNIMLVSASLTASEIISKDLLIPRLSSILCSATLTSSGSFSYIKERLGLCSHKQAPYEEIFLSPFDYQTRTLFAVVKDMPQVSSVGFLQASAEAIISCVNISCGSCLVLFTSYDMLEKVYQIVDGRLEGYSLLKQGSASRQQLIKQFKAQEGNVLFATDSFWEGVDIPGEALRCVIIVKLPFKVPTDPFYEAFSEMYKKENKDPFLSYSLPSAVIKFKQGFGRLMRKEGDRGCVICLDNRIVDKAYGSYFLRSIPESHRIFDVKDNVYQEMKRFYEKTYRFVCRNLTNSKLG